jgi:hypothetical protein
VSSTAVPTLLPICIAVFAVAAAMPARRGSTPLGARDRALDGPALSRAELSEMAHPGNTLSG